MAAQALYRKWRSQSFDDVVGQEHITVTLRNALREGPGAVERFRVAYSLKKLPELAPNIAKMQETGWDGQNRCGYFDAVEALDLYLPLDWEEEDA